MGYNSQWKLAVQGPQEKLKNAKEYFAARKKVAELMKETSCAGESAGPTASG